MVYGQVNFFQQNILLGHKALCSRAGIALWSIVMPMIFTKLGFNMAGMVMISFLVIAAIIGIVWAPNTRGKTLKEIEFEHYGNSKSGKSGLEVFLIGWIGYVVESIGIKKPINYSRMV
ncbi:hypothetical protein [Metabacillus sp. FJAT-53654]|uniref:Major facilitator superfamily (MFS) profile domain-containing protein n=1 Tax=Metabacillus rhizosphaerae TaxID=3117747 RepID=A0ABZ2MX51_9BACI